MDEQNLQVGHFETLCLFVEHALQVLEMILLFRFEHHAGSPVISAYARLREEGSLRYVVHQ
ncbi:MAG: hypothetical protein KDC41_02860, partial [Saprospiraceae bacterium]|nr:hypothetical protein [Saprospiraceae bacterium]